VLILVVKAYFHLVRFEVLLQFADFETLHRRIRNYPTVSSVANSVEDAIRICSAMDMACVFYWKHVLCLQKSAATVCLLRRCGIPARMVIGAQKLPFKAHAWVEIDGQVINDKPYLPKLYGILDRC
jgi:hypothetical protein